ncbi:hypothetical protein [Phormidium tenue]|jgi:hypothetical protein|uniref:Uncharacterized protein n=1 Tax=Phormidium tenue FACHB-1050 TaxID=2692857 RepID=A0ABR8C8P0_9CYAN|nr:hypothetical protein [Phormidium tenue]MBD2316633.1 hypothetical protein [Phormidium tenue FACHB-1050]
MTIQIAHTPHGWLVFGLGGNLDIDCCYGSDRAAAFQHFIYLLNHGELK